MFLVTRSERPMLRVGKGTVRLYKEVINALQAFHASANARTMTYIKLEGSTSMSSLSATFPRNRVIGSLKSSLDRDI